MILRTPPPYLLKHVWGNSKSFAQGGRPADSLGQRRSDTLGRAHHPIRSREHVPPTECDLTRCQQSQHRQGMYPNSWIQVPCHCTLSPRSPLPEAPRPRGRSRRGEWRRTAEWASSPPLLLTPPQPLLAHPLLRFSAAARTSRSSGRPSTAHCSRPRGGCWRQLTCLQGHMGSHGITWS